jgi:hypothetical protein
MKDYKMTEEKFMAKNHCLKEFTENKTLLYAIRSFIFGIFGIMINLNLFLNLKTQDCVRLFLDNGGMFLVLSLMLILNLLKLFMMMNMLTVL